MMDIDLNSPNVVIAAESVASQLVFVAADSERCRIIYFAHDVALWSWQLWEVVVDDRNVDSANSFTRHSGFSFIDLLIATWKEINVPIDRIPNLKHPEIVALLEGFDKITYYKMKVR
jgi:hypothetical protein